ncbi:hypothetical protein, partial [uncultured Tenacibaculum sp.]|uniref:hypothetical protein n=1 Tax=uncultured Tenacibaculum sp. TaxID=174713 RepID=UPI00261065C6
MKNFSKFSLGALVVSTLLITSCQNENTSDNNLDTNIEANASEGNIIPGQYIVVFKESSVTPSSKLLSKTLFTDRNLKAKAADDISAKSISKMKTILS